MKKKLFKIMAVYIVINLIGQILFPTATYALTSGPTTPEFSSFEPVATTDMVNDFTGDFTYNLPVLNVPGPHGSGYAMSLSYHSGTTPEEEASWVGYGWTLNPGSINRNKKGFADDWNGADVTYHNKVRKNYTLGYGFSGDFSYQSIIGAGLSASVRFNNYKGFGATYGGDIGSNYLGTTVGYNWDDQDMKGSFSIAVNPMTAIESIIGAVAGGNNDNTSKSTPPDSWQGLCKSKLDALKNKWKEKIFAVSHFGLNIGEVKTYAVNVPQYTSFSTNFTYSGSISILGINGGCGYNTSYSYQKYKEEVDRKAYGYLYSHNAAANANATDYSSERELPYEKSDNYLPMPVSDADNFIVSGEGLGGAFRFYNKHAVCFAPPATASSGTVSIHGTYNTVGASLYTTQKGSGTTKNTIDRWGDAGNNDFSSNEDESYFPRFDDDLGGNILYDTGDEAYAADLVQTAGTKDDWIDYEGGIDQSFEYSINESKIPSSIATESSNRVGRSGFIGYHTNKQIAEGITYNPQSDYKGFLERGTSGIKDGIGEIVTYNTAGMCYNYGLPVYARNEYSMRYGLAESDAANISNNFSLTKKDISDENKLDVMVGEECTTPYSYTHLLTSITNPNYIDRTFDGPSNDDFGGWTKFNYTQLYGSTDKTDNSDWFKWRVPYTGLLYDAGSLSTHNDDAGYASFGEKEIYYLKSIETQTHIAVFTTCSRLDGLSAAKNEDAANNSIDKNNLKELKRLDKIELYTKDENGNKKDLIQTVHFVYDYSLMKGRPNSNGSATTTDNTQADGVLTLKKVWTEYNGIINARISPYEFSYEYMQTKDFASSIQSLYPDVISYADNWDASEQNPDYSNCNIDAWGNYQSSGASKYDAMKKWLSQNVHTDEFDPAAWQLKQIQLPSGGKILVQYEQDDYQYVQDYPAFAMVNLLDPKDGKEYKDELNSDNTYYLNLSALGLDDDKDKATLLANYLYDYFIDANSGTYRASGKKNQVGYNTNKGKNMIYAKFLYALGGETPELANNESDYVNGYVYVNTVSSEEIDGKYYIKIGLGTTDFNAYMHDLAHDFVKTNRMGVLSGDAWANDALSDLEDAGVDINDYSAVNVAVGNDFITCKDQVTSTADVFNFIKDAFTGDVVSYVYTSANNCNDVGCEFNIGDDYETSTCTRHCAKINLTNSYLKIPLNFGKKGGGLRVKRLLMYDDGLLADNGDAVLYGNEYAYQKEDGYSSGVATNEPKCIKEECGLTQLLNHSDNTDFAANMNIFGLDRRQVSGPIGEDLLPGASVGYSRVVEKNIHSGNNNPGFTVKKFYTAYDYPVSIDISGSPEMQNYDPVVETPTLEDILQSSLAYQSIENSAESFANIEEAMQNFSPTGSDAKSTLQSWHDEIQDISDTCSDFKKYLAGILQLLKDIIDIIEKCDFETGNWGECLEAIATTLGDSIASLGQFLFDSLSDALANIGNFITEDINQRHINNIWATQGYSISLNSMHGQPKQVAMYEGDYAHINSPSNTTQISGVTYAYVEPGDLVEVVSHDDNITQNETSSDYLGKTMEIVMEAKSVKNEYESSSENDMCDILGIAIPQQITNIKSEEKLYTHVTTKIIHYPAIVSSITTYNEGVQKELEYIAYNKDDGEPIVSETKDEFDGESLQLSASHDGTYTSYTIPASHEYEAMGQKAQNEGFVKASINGTYDWLQGENYNIKIDFLKNSSLPNGGYYLELSKAIALANTSDVTNKLNAGDFIAIISSSEKDYVASYAYITSVSSSKIDLDLVALNLSSDFFIGEKDVNLVVLKSAYTNQLNDVAGTVLTYGDCNNGTVWNAAVDAPAYIESAVNSYMENYWSSIGQADNFIEATTLYGAILNSYLNSIKVNVDILTNVNIPVRETDYMKWFFTEYTNYNIDSQIQYVQFKDMVNNYKAFNAASIANSVNWYTGAYFSSINSLNKKLNIAIASIQNGESLTFTYYKKANATTNTSMMRVKLDKDANGGLSLQITNGINVYTYSLDAEGIFSVDENGKSTYTTSNASSINIDGFSGNNSGVAVATYDELCSVIKASATIYSDEWDMSSNINDAYSLSDDNEYLSGEKGKWRPQSIWVYNDSIIGGNEDEKGERIYLDAGAVSTFYMFNWSSSALVNLQHDNWSKVDVINYYSPNGDVLQEKNLFDVYSTAKFGYCGSTVPYLVASNAEYASVMFESFENNYSEDGDGEKEYEDGYTLTEGSTSKTIAHSGSQSLLLQMDMKSITPSSTPTVSNYTKLPLKEFSLTNQTKNDGMLVRLWIRTKTGTEPTLSLQEKSNLFTDVSFTKVARVWDWMLYEANVNSWSSMVVGDAFTPVVKISGLNADDYAWLDDIRVQPASAEMNCYVYDPSTLNILASFDSQHFGLYYQYNAEGKLIRKLAETEKGKYTLSEAYYNATPFQHPETISDCGESLKSKGITFTWSTTTSFADVADLKNVSDFSTGYQLTVSTIEQAVTSSTMYESIMNDYLKSVYVNIDIITNTDMEISKEEYMKSFYTNYVKVNSTAISYTAFYKMLTTYEQTYSSSFLNNVFNY